MHRNRKKLILFGILTLGMMIVIFCFSAQDASISAALSRRLFDLEIIRKLLEFLPKLSEQEGDHDLRKYAHMLEYFLLALSAAAFFLEWHCSRRKGRVFCDTAGFCFLYACSDEWHQTFVPGRAGRATDVLIDMIGVAVGMLVFFACRARKEKS